MTEVRWDMLANLGNNFVASYDAARKRKMEELELQATSDTARAYLNARGGDEPSAASGPTLANPVPQASAAPRPRAATGALAATTGGDNAYRGAIAGIESSGRYDIVGPTHPRYGRALGKYQVMEANVGPWSREALGREVSADEFLAKPEIQDAIFDHKFGQFAQKHGLEGAAAMWFSGSPNVNSGSRDSLGTSVPKYVSMFRAGMARSGGAPASDLPAPGAQPAQGFVPPKPEAPAAVTPMGQPTPAAPAQAQSAQAAIQTPPAVTRRLPPQVKAMLESANPYTQKKGIELAQKYAADVKWTLTFAPNGQGLWQNDQGQAFPAGNFAKPEEPKTTTVAPGSALVETGTGRKIYQNPKTESDTVKTVAPGAALVREDGSVVYERPKETTLSASDKKAILESEDANVELGSTVTALRRALELNPKTFTGFLAGTRGALGSKLPDRVVPDFLADPEGSKATVEWQSIMSPEALTRMGAALKGATTDFELRKFEALLADPSTPADVRAATIKRMLTLAERRFSLNEERIRDMRGGTYYKPGAGLDASSSDLPKGKDRAALPDGYTAAKALAEARSAVAAGKDKAAVAERLRSFGIDPARLD